MLWKKFFLEEKKNKYMENQDIFSVVSPLGYTVVCTQHQWDTHIAPGHPELQGREEDVKETVREPLKIYESKVHPERHIYYSFPVDVESESRYTKVVTGPDKKLKTVYSTITAFDVKKIGDADSKGVVLYDANSTD